MSATPNCQRIESAVLAKFPDARFGRYNCRHVGSDPKKIWSQHAASESNKYFGNALDITHKDYGYSTHPLHQIWLLRVKAFIRANFDDTIRLLLAPGNRAHSDHVHVDTFPKMEDAPNYVPPCKGGTLVVVNKDGSLDSTFGDAPPPPPPPTMEDTMWPLLLDDGKPGSAREYKFDDVMYVQKRLRRLGNTLSTDGWCGPSTIAICAAEISLDLTDRITGEAGERLSSKSIKKLSPAVDPPEAHDHDGDYAPTGHGHPKPPRHDHDDAYAAKVHPHQVPGQTIT